MLGYGRIQQLGNAVDHFDVFHREHYRRAEIVKALDVRGNVRLAEYVGDLNFKFDVVRGLCDVVVCYLCVSLPFFVLLIANDFACLFVSV